MLVDKEDELFEQLVKTINDATNTSTVVHRNFIRIRLPKNILQRFRPKTYSAGVAKKINSQAVPLSVYQE